MAIFFFDTSALVKHYILETGTAWVQSLSNPALGHDRFIAEITGVEMIAAVTRRQRQGNTSSTDATTAIVEFEADFAGGYVLLEVTRERVLEAMDVARRHGLRGYDAVQLAIALRLRTRCRASGSPDPTLVTADIELLNAAFAEGLPVDNPNTHP